MKNLVYFRCFLFLSMLLCFSNYLLAQSFKGIATKSNAPLIEQELFSWEVYKIDASAIAAAVIAADASTPINLELGTHHWNLQLETSQILSEYYFVQVQKEDGQIEKINSTVKAYKGHDTNSGGQVRLTLDHDFIYGFVENGTERYYIEPLRYFDPWADSDLFIVYAKSAVNRDAYNMACSVIETENKLLGIESKDLGHTSESALCYKVELVMASDKSMLTKYGNAGAVENHNVGVLNNVQGDYSNAFNHDIEFDIVTQFIATGNGPWSASTNADTLLKSFKAWGEVGNFGVNYDLAELWTDRDFDGPSNGISYLDGFCSANKYNCLQDFSANGELLRCLTSHEIGHNFGAIHDVCPPNTIMCPMFTNSNTWSASSVSTINASITQLVNSGCLSTCSACPTPEASFTFSITDQTITITNTSIDATDYTWDFGDTNTSTQSDPVHTYSDAGIYIVTLIATNPCGSDTITSAISTAPTAGFSADPVSGCATLLVYMTNESSINATNFQWSFPGGTPAASNQINPVVLYATPGTYPVTLTVFNSSGIDTFTRTDYIQVNTVPQANFSFSTNQKTVTFTNSSTSATSYSWDFGDGNISTQVSPVHTYQNAGIYIVVLTAINPCGTTTKSLVVNTAPTAGFSAEPDTGCAALFVTLMNESSANATSYLWSFPGGTPTSSNLQNPGVVYFSPGTYSVSLTAFNSSGSDAFTRTDYIQVNTVPQTDFSFSTNQNTVTFTNTSTNATSYSWDFGDGNTSTQVSPVHTYAALGSYDVMLTATNDCGVITITHTVGINTALPTADFSVSPLSGCVPMIVQYNNQSIGVSPINYNWSFPGGNPSTSTEASPIVSYSSPGLFSATLIATNGSGSDTLIQDNLITVNPQNASAGPDQVVCSGQSVHLQASGGSIYQWGSGGPAASDWIFIPSGSGTFTVTITDGGCTATKSVQVTVLPPITIAGIQSSGLSGSFTVSGGQAQVDGSNYESVIMSLQNNPNITSTLVAAPFSHVETVNFSALQFGVYNVIVVDTNGCVGGGIVLVNNGLIGLDTLPYCIEWQKTLGGSGSEEGYSIQETSDGGFIIAGGTASNDGDVAGNHGGIDFWVVKLNSGGVIQWQKALGGSGWEEAYSIQETSDGGFIIAGGTASNDGDVTGHHGGIDFWVVKLNSGGVIQWQRTLGGSEDEAASSIQETSDGGFIVTGYTFSNDGDVSGNHGISDFWVVKLTSTGIIEWQRTYGGSAGEPANSVKETRDGGFIVVGATGSNDGDVSGHLSSSDFWVLRLTSNGTIQWQRALGGNFFETANSVQETSDGGFIVAGGTASNDSDVSGNHGSLDIWIVKLSLTGAIQWQRALGGTDYETANTIQETSDGGFIVSGETASNNGDVSGHHGSSDIWVVKINASGFIQWQKVLGGSGMEEAYSIQELSDGGLLVSGFTTSNDGDVAVNHGLQDFWVVKLKPCTPTCTLTTPPSITGPSSLCSGFATLQAGTFDQYTWSNGLTDSSITITQTGTYTVTVTDTNGCTGTTSHTLTGNATPTAQLSANDNSGLPGDLLICSGEGVVFTASGGTQYQFWVNGVAQTPGFSTNNTLSLNPFLANSTVKVLILDSNGCPDETLIGEGAGLEPISLSLSPLPNLANFSATLLPDCPGEVQQLSLQASGLSDGNYSVEYSINNGATQMSTLTFSSGLGTLPLGLLPPQLGASCQILQLSFVASGCAATPMLGAGLTFDVLPPIQATLDTSICNTQSIVIGGQTYNQAGMYQIPLTTASNCDSLLTLNLQVVPQFTKLLNATICEGETYVFYQNSLTQQGNYQHTALGPLGCDTLVTLSLVVKQPVFSSLNKTLCPGVPFELGDSVFTNAGLYQVTLKSASNCDSIINLNLQASPINLAFPQPTLDICQGNSVALSPAVLGCQNCQYQWTTGASQNTITVSPGQNTEYTLSITDSQGCTLSAMVQVNVHANYDQTQEILLCPGDTIRMGGLAFTQAGTYQLDLQTAFGCDSSILLTLEEYDLSLLQAAEDTVLMPPDGSLTTVFTVTDNDALFRPDYKLEIYSNPSQGIVTVVNKDRLRYTLSNPDFYGIDQFQYALCPATDCPDTCSIAWVFVKTQATTLEKIKKLIPNIVTPNGDTHNDVFDPLPVLHENDILVEGAQLFIINRWGEVIYEDNVGYWEPGAEVPQATYYYRLQITVEGAEYHLQGPINLLR